MTMETGAEYKTGRRVLVRLSEADLLSAVSDFCRRHSISMATFQAAGAVSRFTLGVYDPTQQVYVTHTEEAPREIVSCWGTVTAGDGNPVPAGHIGLADDRGRVTGGRLFSETRVICAELVLTELTGPDLTRRYDPATGLELWERADSGESARGTECDGAGSAEWPAEAETGR